MSIIKNYFKQNKVTHTFSSCQWPIGDPQEKDFHFCEANTLAGNIPKQVIDNTDHAINEKRPAKKSEDKDFGFAVSQVS